MFIVGCTSEHQVKKGSIQKKVAIHEGILSNYKGILVKGFETFYFKPDGLDEKWHVNYKSLKAKGWSSIKLLLNAQCKSTSTIPCRYQHRSTKMKGKGVVSKQGKYGHLGYYPREIIFTTIDIERGMIFSTDI